MSKQNVLVMRDSDNYKFCLSKKNPYLPAEFSNSVVVDVYNYIMPEDIVEKALLLESYICPVKFFCFVDILMGLYYFVVNFYFGLIAIICSTLGYASTTNFKKSHLKCYLIYLIFLLFINIFNLVLYFILLNYHNKNIIIENLNVTQNSTLLTQFEYFNSVFIIPILVVRIMIQSIIIKYIYKFYHLLPKSTDKYIVRRAIL